MRQVSKWLLTFLFLFLSFPFPVFAEQPHDKQMTGVITAVTEEKMIHIEDKEQRYQKLDVLLTDGKDKGKIVQIENGKVPMTSVIQYHKGDTVLVTATQGPDNTILYYITDFVRTTALYWLFGLFVVLTIVIGGKRGLLALVGMGFSFLIIFTFLLPQLLAGNDPITIAILTALTIIPVTFVLSHGFSKKTIAAMLGTGIALIITGLIATFFIDFVRLTGFSSDEASFVQAMNMHVTNMRGLLLAGIIIGSLGVLDDITITQAAIVAQLKKAAPHLSFREIFIRSMAVGKDHIASVVNTLILVYTGASLPLLLLFINNPLPFTQVINYEIIAEEIVRTLVASMGLILAIPITSFLADFLLHESIPEKEKKQRNNVRD
jgi:uncharacterized membrane protein